MKDSIRLGARALALGLGLGLGAWEPGAWAQTATAVILPNGKTQFTNANGTPLAAGKVYFYVPTTTTPKTTWQDPYQTTANPNPITLDGSGEALIWGSGIYREVVYDLNGNLIWDQLTGGYNCVGGGGSGTPAGLVGALQWNNSGSFAGLSLGLSQYVLHGNAAGAPTWSQVNMATDVTGTLSGANITTAGAADVQQGVSTTLVTTPSALAGSLFPQTVAYASTETINWQAGGYAVTTLAGNITSLVLQNPVAGATYHILLIQGGSGSNTVTWPGTVDWGAAGAPTLSTALGKVDHIELFAANTGLYLGSYHLGY